MKCLAKIFLCLVGAIAAVGCSEIEENFTGGAGYLAVELTVDAGVDGGLMEVLPPPVEDFAVTLSEAMTGVSYTWSRYSQFSQNQQYIAGDYTVRVDYGSIDNEGFDSPWFTGEVPVSISAGEVANVEVMATLASTVVSISYTDAFKAYFSDWSVMAHSAGGAYVTFERDETRVAYLRPGDVSVLLNLTFPTGEAVTISPLTINDAKARCHYGIVMDVADRVLNMTVADGSEERTTSVVLSDELIHGAAPEVTGEGFVPGTRLLMKEGGHLAEPIAMKINARSELKEAILTTMSSAPIVPGWPAEIDLLKVDGSTREVMESMGLKTDLWNGERRQARIDFTEELFHRLSEAGGIGETSFTLVVKDNLTRVNVPVSLVIGIEPVDLTVKGVSTAIMGIDKATITVEAPVASLADNVRVQAFMDEKWLDLPIVDVVENAGAVSTYDIIVGVPAGSSSIDVRILYNGTEKGRATIQRQAPDYEVSVDPFASRAKIKISGADQSVVDMVTRYIKVYINNSPASILERDPSNGLLTILGLSPQTTYSLKTATVDNPTGGDFSAPVGFRTEGTPQLPNSSFEDVKAGVQYADMPSGGLYSQNSVEIFNRQNRSSFNLSVPTKGWANTNPKTFCKMSTNHNTWYMQPSVFTVSDAAEGGYAVEIRSVGFDITGEDIPPYLQQQQPFTSYSLNVPTIKYRAAGKLFLGEYMFDYARVEELLNEGIEFGARPMSLSGEYKYAPCSELVSDCGLVKVEVIGSIGNAEVTIATGVSRLPLASTYTSFSVPLTYKQFGIKAQRIKVMFASTERAGSIEEERTAVVTLDDPATSTSVGSRLIIDNLTLSY